MTKILSCGLLLAVFILLGVLVVAPSLDLTVSGWFYQAGLGFSLAHHPFFHAMEKVAFDGPRVLGIVLAVLAVFCFFKRQAVVGLDAKAWLFLLLGLLIGPGLIANVIFKDHWGRARPREIAEFGGHAVFSPALMPQPNAHTNGSFVSGDASFGFYLPAFAYVAPRSRTRRVFWGGIALGGLFGFCRVVMGAHFLSDVLFAAVFMLVASGFLHAAMYGRRTTHDYWRRWAGFNES